MHTLIGALLILAGIATSYAGERSDYIIPAATWTSVPINGKMLGLRVSHTIDKVKLWRGYGYGDQIFKKVKGMDSTDTNRTLIYQSGNARLYFVDTMVGADKIKLAVIVD